MKQNPTNPVLERQTQPSPQNLTRRTLGALFWSSSGTGVQAVLQVIVTVILARLLTPADFGLVSAAMVAVGFCQIFAQLGVGPAIVQRPELAARHLRTGFTLSMMFGLLLAGLVTLLAPAISRFFRMEGLTLVLRALALIFVLKSLSVVSESLLQRELRFRSLASVQVASFALGYGLVGVSLAWFGFGAWALVSAQLAQTTLEAVILLVIQPHPKRLSLNVRAFKELMYFGGGMTMAKIANYFALQGDNIVVGRWLGADALGFYSRAYRLIALPANLFGEAADKVLFPAMAKVQNEPQRLTTAFRRGIVLVSLLILPASVTIFILSPEIVYVLLGPHWGGVVGPLQVLSLGIFFRTGYKMSGTLARAKGVVHQFALIKVLYAVLVVGGALIGQRFGLTGVAIGVLGALTVHFFLMSQLSLKNTLMSWSAFLTAHVPAVILTIIISAVSWGTATLMRGFNSPAFATLSTTITVVLVCMLVIVRFMPVWSIGKDGVWWLQTLSKNLPLNVNLVKQKS